MKLILWGRLEFYLKCSDFIFKRQPLLLFIFFPYFKQTISKRIWKVSKHHWNSLQKIWIVFDWNSQLTVKETISLDYHVTFLLKLETRWKIFHIFCKMYYCRYANVFRETCVGERSNRPLSMFMSTKNNRIVYKIILHLLKIINHI